MLLMSCGPEETPTTSPTPTATQPTATQPTATQPTATQPTATSPGLGDLAKPAGGVNGGRIQFAVAGAVLNLSDISGGAGPSDAGYVFPVVEPLLRLDGNSVLQPWLAERFTIADDFSSMTLYLRHGVKFHDGTDFTADAVKWNLDIAAASTVYTQMHALESPVIIDDYTVRLDFKDGVWNWDAAKGLAYWWGALMYSPTAARTHDSDWLKTHVVGTGPFMLREYTRDQKAAYDAFPDYWRGEPYVDGIDINIIPDATTQLLAYKAGELDTIGVQLKDVDRLMAEGFDIIQSEDAIFNYALIPSSADPNSPLNNLLVRQAVQHAIDKDALIEGITYGYGKATNQIFAIAPYNNPEVVGYDYDPVEARRLLALAGYEDGLELTLTYNEFGVQEIPLALQDMFADVGITLNLNKLSYLVTAAMIFTNGWDGFLMSFTFPGKTIDPGFTAGMYITQSGWVSFLKPADIAAVINEAATEPDAASRTAMYQDISQMITDQCLFQFLYYVGGFTSITPFVTGYTIGQYKEFYAWTYAYFPD